MRRDYTRSSPQRNGSVKMLALNDPSTAEPCTIIPMADRVEREIEEILARLDSDLPRDGAGTAPPAERKPISISNVREQRAKQQKRSMPRRNLPIEPATLLFGGAGIMVGGLILSMFYSPLLWLAFAGVVLFIAAFVWSIFRQAPERPVSGGPPRQGGKVFWRDRYIDVTPDASVGSKLMRRVRRK